MIIWFERLTVPKLVFSLTRRLVNRKTEVYFTEVSLCAGVFLRLFAKVLPRLHKQGFLLGVRQENGEALLYRVHELTTTAVNRVFEEFFSGTGYIPASLRKHSLRIHRAFKAHLVTLFKPKISFLCAVEYACFKELSFKNRKIRYYLDATPLQRQFNSAVSPFFKGEVCGFFSLITAIKESLPGRVLRFMSGVLNRQGDAGKYFRLAKDGRSKVLIEFSRYKFGNEDYIFLFWFSKSGIEPERVIMGFDRPDSPYCEENIRLIEQRGLSWLNLKKGSLPMHLGLLEWLGVFWSVLKKTPLPGSFDGTGIWTWKAMFEFAFFLDIWRVIFRKYGIKVMHQHQEHDFWAHIQSLALNLEGGIYLWYHWSVQRVPFSHFNAGYCDVFFSWGRFHRDYLDMHDFEYRYMVDIGLIWDYVYNGKKDNSPSLMHSANSNIDFVIALFDVGSSFRSQFSPYLESDFYRTMLQLVREHPRWGVIIKSKNGLTHLPRLKEINDLIGVLTQEKRCIHLPPVDPPSAAFKVADACVCNGVNSAGAIAALCGKKVIHWDSAGDARHPYYLNGSGKIIFKTKEEVIEALESLAQQKGDQGPLGNHSAWLDFLDPYRDGRGGLRAGQFISSFLAFTDKGLHGERALEKTIEKFKEEWGSNRVYAFETKVNRLNDNIWVKAEQVLKK